MEATYGGRPRKIREGFEKLDQNPNAPSYLLLLGLLVAEEHLAELFCDVAELVCAHNTQTRAQHRLWTQQRGAAVRQCGGAAAAE